MNVDLHSHSIASDGLLPPAEVAARAHAGGVDVWALTDHDETGGLAEAAAAATALGMRFVPGVEISVTWRADANHAGTTIHVVGLNIDPHNAALAAGLAGINGMLQASPPLAGNGYDQPRSLPRDFAQAHAALATSAVARQLLGERFVTGYCAVKALEHDSYLGEISAWERRYLLPLV